MEVKPGYKQTEVGVIPEDWEVEASCSDRCQRSSADGFKLTSMRISERGVADTRDQNI